MKIVTRTVKDWNSLPRSAVEIVEDAKFRNYFRDRGATLRLEGGGGGGGAPLVTQ